MKNWQEDLVTALDGAHGVEAIFDTVQASARQLEFDFCAYGLRVPFPLSSPRCEMINNYPDAWRKRYQEQKYLSIDPTVQHARRCRQPALWDRQLFAAAPLFWDEARAAGLRHGWFQSCTDDRGVAGMLTLVRSGSPITAAELAAHGAQLRWLVQLTHQRIAQLMAPRMGLLDQPSLTEREVEVLQWSADGKTTGEISEILAISESTVNFHVKRAMVKLDTPNKTAAVVRAALLGLLT